MNNPKATPVAKTLGPKTKKTPLAKAAATLADVASQPVPTAATRASRFDSLKLDQSYTDPGTAVSNVLLPLEIKRPTKGAFFRVHPDYRFDTQAIDRGMDGGWYLVTRETLPALASDVVPVALRMYVEADGKLGLWPLKLEKGDGSKANPFNVSAMSAANQAVDSWLSLQNAGSHYVARIAISDLGAPKWPTQSWDEVLDMAFGGRIIDSLQHSVAKKILGAL